ncbi:MAG: nuclear transport factor 2 family protein [Xanthomonadales bacterium]|nr:nuclear transport factor 2 family protein [Xanthomonadales bacterium]
MLYRLLALLSLPAMLLTVRPALAMDDIAELTQRVADTERAFAATMADRDLAAFAEFLDEDTIFFAGEQPIQGKAAVIDAWRGYYDGETAPFSWAPSTVAVRPGGQLALSSGPVLNAAGQQIAVFQSIWQRRPDGDWKIIFDKGARYCGGNQVDE